MGERFWQRRDFGNGVIAFAQQNPLPALSLAKYLERCVLASCTLSLIMVKD